MATNVPGIYAAGDITSYPGKLKLIATGAAEACIAVNNAVHYINPKAKVNPGHSSNLAIFGQNEGLRGRGPRTSRAARSVVPHAILGLRKNRSSPAPRLEPLQVDPHHAALGIVDPEARRLAGRAGARPAPPSTASAPPARRSRRCRARRCARPGGQQSGSAASASHGHRRLGQPSSLTRISAVCAARARAREHRRWARSRARPSKRLTRRWVFRPLSVSGRSRSSGQRLGIAVAGVGVADEEEEHRGPHSRRGDAVRLEPWTWPADAQGSARRARIPPRGDDRRRIALLPPTHLHHHAVDRHDRGRPTACGGWPGLRTSAPGRSARSMNPDREFTPPMLPSFARTRPSSGVSEEPAPERARACPTAAARRERSWPAGGDRMKRRIWVKASGAHQVAAREARAVLAARTRSSPPGPNRSGIGARPPSPSSHEPALAELAAELLEQHLGEPVLAGVEDREHPLAERPRADLRERRGAPEPVR